MTTPNPFGANPFEPGHGNPLPPGLPQPPPARDEPNTLATLSVVFAFVFAPAGALLGHLGLSQIAQSGQRGRERALVGVTLSYVFITAAVVSLVVWAALGDNDSARTAVQAPNSTSSAPAPSSLTTTTLTSPPPPPTVAPAALEGLLATVQEIEAIPGLSDDMKLRGAATGLLDRRADNNMTITPADCYTAYGEADSHGYDAAAVRGLQANGFSTVPSRASMDQAVVAFDDAAAAQAGLQKLLATWRSCGGSTFSYSDPSGGGRVATWTVSVPVDAGNGITTLNAIATKTMTGHVRRAIAVKANVLIDVSATSRPGPDLTPAAVAVVNVILGKIPGPR